MLSNLPLNFITSTLYVSSGESLDAGARWRLRIDVSDAVANESKTGALALFATCEPSLDAPAGILCRRVINEVRPAEIERRNRVRVLTLEIENVSDEPITLYGAKLSLMGYGPAPRMAGETDAPAEPLTQSETWTVTARDGVAMLTAAAERLRGENEVMVNYEDVQNKPDTFPPSAHTHAASDVTSGTFDVARLPSASTTTKGATQYAADGSATAGRSVEATDGRLSNARTPSGGAGGVLSGNYPNPGFAVDMATQSELDNAVNSEQTARTNADNQLAGLISTETTNRQNADTTKTEYREYNTEADIPAGLPPKTLVHVRNSTVPIASAINAKQIQNVAVAATAPANGQTLTFNSTSSQYEPTTPATGGSGGTGASFDVRDAWLFT